MKINNFTFRTGWLMILLWTSCSDFLKESSQDELIPSTVDDLRSVMYKEAYPYHFNCDNYIPLLTDEIQCNGLHHDTYAGALENGTPVYTFNPEMFDGTEAFPSSENSWKTYYEKIKGCNVIIEQLPEVNGSESDKNALLGQSLLLRGLYYMKLVLLYGQAYTNENVDPSTALGVPLVLTMDVSDDYPVRNTLEEVYARIENDLTTSARLLKENYSTESVFRVGHVTAYALLTRFYLYKGDYEKVLEYAEYTIEEGPALTRLESIEGTDYRIYDYSVSNEVIWVYGSPSRNCSYNISTWYGNSTGPVPFTVSASLLGMYHPENDLRYRLYFFHNTVTSISYSYAERTNKVSHNTHNYGDRGIRMGEVYVNRAEAAARIYMKNGDDVYRIMALADLNILREKRYRTGTHTEINFTDASRLLDFCLEERQREMCLEEGLRWFDIKRLGLSVTHEYTDTENVTTEYKLEAGSNLYALPIPHDAVERNYKLVQNPR